MVESLIPQRRRPKLGGLDAAAPCSPLAISRLVINSSFDIRLSSFDSSVLSASFVVVCLNLFQEEIHAIEINYGMADVQRIHSKNATDSRAALPQGETR